MVYLNTFIHYRQSCKILCWTKSLWWLHLLTSKYVRFCLTPSYFWHAESSFIFLDYNFSFYSQLSVTIMSDHWKTALIPFQWGVFQGDTLSPHDILLVFNTLLQLSHPCDCTFQLPVSNSDSFLPISSFVYVLIVWEWWWTTWMV